MSKGSQISKAISLLPHYTEAQANGGDNLKSGEYENSRNVGIRDSKSTNAANKRKSNLFKMEHL